MRGAKCNLGTELCISVDFGSFCGVSYLTNCVACSHGVRRLKNLSVTLSVVVCCCDEPTKQEGQWQFAFQVWVAYLPSRNFPTLL